MLQDIAFVIPSIVNAAGLDRLIREVYGQAGVVPDVCIYSNGPAIDAVAFDWRDRWAVPVLGNGQNDGVACAWNRLLDWAFLRGQTAAIVSNDDITLPAPDVLQRFLDLHRQHPDAVITAGRQGWHFFLIPAHVFAAVGPFDEGFWPGYREDWDYMIRLRQAGIEEVEGPIVGHEEGTSQKLDPSLDRLLKISDDWTHSRFAAKWNALRPRDVDLAGEPWGGEQPWPEDQIKKEITAGMA